MTDKKSIKRREFLKLSSTAMVAGLAGGLTGNAQEESAARSYTIEEAARKVGQLPRTKLGCSGREVSIIVGSGDLAAAPREAGILCGMNYWHKANQWIRSGTPDSILKNREGHYCQVTVDRVGGDHHGGRIDEEEHYAWVKEVLKRTGLGYFDDMQLHYGYHSREELKQERGFVRAFERLKKEGLVKHLCLSQHSYSGNARVPDGESAAEVLTAVVEDGIHEHAQFMYSYGGDPEMDEFVEFARKKGFGTIAMKTARGIGRIRDDPVFMEKLPAGVSPHNALVRWLTTKTGLDAVVMRVKNLNEFVESFSGAGKELRASDTKAIRMMTEQADRTACRLCAKCQPHCPQQVPIAEILRFERYAMDDHDWGKARKLYAELDRKGDACVQCETCIPFCPQALSIPEKIAAAHTLLR